MSPHLYGLVDETPIYENNSDEKDADIVKTNRSHAHLFLHCPVAWGYSGARLWSVKREWVCPASIGNMMLIRLAKEMPKYNGKMLSFQFCGEFGISVMLDFFFFFLEGAAYL